LTLRKMASVSSSPACSCSGVPFGAPTGRETLGQEVLINAVSLRSWVCSVGSPHFARPLFQVEAHILVRFKKTLIVPAPIPGKFRKLQKHSDNNFLCVTTGQMVTDPDFLAFI